MKTPDRQIAHQLQMVVNGAAVHTINKAYFYYMSERTGPKRLANLDRLIRQALVTNEWSTLRIFMNRWW